MSKKIKHSKLYFKCLPKNGTTFGYKWPPIGKWTKKLPHVYVCHSGYHLTNLSSIRRWHSSRPLLYLAEGRGATNGTVEFNKAGFYKGDKIAVAQARLIRLLPTDKKTLYPIYKLARELFAKNNETFWYGNYSINNFYRLLSTMDEWTRSAVVSTRKEVSITILRHLELAWNIDLGLPQRKKVYL